MQVVEHRCLNAGEARAITDRIRSSMGDLMALVVKAHIGRAWIALGYQSWADYIKGEFDHAPLSLPRDERLAVVALLRGQGMSTRAIGSAAGVAEGTVRNDLAGAQNYAPDEAVPVTGLDGKNYPGPPRRGPKPQRREPITNAFCRLCVSAATLERAIGRLAADDRTRGYRDNRGSRNDLIRLRGALDDLIERMAPPVDDGVVLSVQHSREVGSVST
jgi:hypothetical protein